MPRPLYSEGFFGGGLKRDKRAERKRDNKPLIPGSRALVILAIIALILVIASVIDH